MLSREAVITMLPKAIKREVTLGTWCMEDIKCTEDFLHLR